MASLHPLRAAAVALLGGTLLVSGCAGSPGASSPTVTVTATATVTAEPETEASAGTIAETEAEPESDMTAAVVGEPAEHAGVRLTVSSAKSSDTVTRNVTNSRQGSGYEEYEEIPADEGGRFIVVEAEVENTGQESMDLTCSWPINIKVIDREMREFDTVDELYSIKGNPECNAQLQPGFSDTITYAFMVPEDAEVPGLYFHDTQSMDEEPSVVSFGSDL